MAQLIGKELAICRKEAEIVYTCNAEGSRRRRRKGDWERRGTLVSSQKERSQQIRKRFG